MSKEDKIQKILSKDAYFTIQNNSYCFLPGDRAPQHTAGKDLLGKIQDRLKSYGKVYYLLLKLVGPVFSSLTFRKSIRKCLDKYNENHVILNLGSGPQHFYGRTDIINIDLFAFDEVDIVADAFTLPLEDRSADLIVNMAMLEHVDNPEVVVKEMYRTLKPGGDVLAYVPFIVPYHAAPHDFYRWTRQGAGNLFSCFDNINISVGCGPTSGMLYVLQEWLSTILSFGSKTLHDVWFILLILLLFPIKYLDIFISNFKFASNVASGFVILASKSLNP
jgi:SAM-dependent methyltransferase